MIRDMVFSRGKAPDQEGINRPGPHASPLEKERNFWHVGHQPFKLGSAEIRVKAKPSLGGDQGLQGQENG